MTDEEKKERKPYILRTLRAKQGQLIYLEKKYQQNKLKRFAYTVLAYAVAIFIIFNAIGIEKTIGDYIGAFVVSLILSGILVTFSTVIFHQLFERSEAENKELENLKKEIDQLQKKFDYLDT